jgi:hypothetical protein
MSELIEYNGKDEKWIYDAFEEGNSKNYKCVGFLEFRSCYDIKIKVID